MLKPRSCRNASLAFLGMGAITFAITANAGAIGITSETTTLSSSASPPASASPSTPGKTLLPPPLAPIPGGDVATGASVNNAAFPQAPGSQAKSGRKSAFPMNAHSETYGSMRDAPELGEFPEWVAISKLTATGPSGEILYARAIDLMKPTRGLAGASDSRDITLYDKDGRTELGKLRIPPAKG